ncbi:FMRFamide receptor [Magallana gigas]|uniref:FMRFamide receptor n=1 Tax=Magallana gigas TaxID=29159 RepID=UPI00333EB3AD
MDDYDFSHYDDEDLKNMNSSYYYMLLHNMNLSDIYHHLNGTYGTFDYENDCSNQAHPHTLFTQDLPGYQKFFNIFLPTACAIGIVGIVLTVVVLGRKNMTTSTNSYLTALAIADLGFLVFLVSKFFGSEEMSVEVYYKYYFYTGTIAPVFVETFLMASVWLTVVLAVERYIAICHPLKAIAICTVNRARLIIAGIFIFSFIIRIPRFFEFKLMTMSHCGKELVHIMPTEMVMSKYYTKTYPIIVDCIVGCVLPLVALVLFNIKLILEIAKSSNYPRFHDVNMQNMIAREQLKITLMLVGIIVVFFVCQAPILVSYTVRHILSYTVANRQQLEIFNLVTLIALSLLTFKSSVNFIVYCWFSEKFWNTFKRVFCGKTCLDRQKCPRKHHTHTVHSADQNGSTSVRKASYMTKDTIC